LNKGFLTTVWILTSSVLGNIITSFIYNEVKKRKAEEEAVNYAKKTGKPILNIGCRRRLFNAGVTVHCDIKPMHPNVLYCDAHNLKQFKDKTFSVALLSHVLEHLENPVKALQEAQRVADRVIIVTPKPWQLTNWLNMDHRWLIRHHKNYIEFIPLYRGKAII